MVNTVFGFGRHLLGAPMHGFLDRLFPRLLIVSRLSKRCWPKNGAAHDFMMLSMQAWQA